LTTHIITGKRLLLGLIACAALAGADLRADGHNKPAAKAATAAEGPVKVLLSTSMGDITVELDAAKAPVSVKNFQDYVNAGHYNGTVFHRVISTFMIQGGGYTETGYEKPTRNPIKLESQNGLKNVRGTIAMARTNVPDSATSQFFINVKDNPALDYPSRDGHGYAVFGKVTAGMDVVDKIKGVPVSPKGPHQHMPDTPVVIKSAKVLGK
jgi:cyclophilin family peptidyl-prolyl cis-trans isomerase